ncbi:alpha/beta fold hydrolase [Methylacidiphilum caldifontis]|uniref:Alpha/beta hydrolase n=1 Tax=Methylacidiphilum caldifontis TaxID=2795386 RepID=A0A4Y8PHT8_9BACT|nr:alpha/beta fold hydrolase [Methylacidiphilum caldifontis]QSR88681.1 alpha/beta fold hydrolase [Methylacidiphilum caldifontis]TFE73299.1 alpha/beta hydrolase [Methylacidiphilum caldifontis]
MKLFFRQTGRAKNSVFLFHGLYGSSFNWASIASHLSQLYQVFAFDLRNHGLSPTATFMDYQLMAEDILQTVGHLDIFPVHVVGHSVGGKLAMVLALVFQSRIKSIVIEDIAPVDYGQAGLELHLKILKALKQLPIENIKTRKEAERLLFKEIDDLSIVQFLLTNLIYEKAKYAWRIKWEGIENSIEKLNSFPEINSSFNGESLFVFGEKSSYFHPSFIPKIKFYFPKASCVRLQGTGHWVHYEKPKEFCDLLCLFFEKVQNTLFT